MKDVDMNSVKIRPLNEKLKPQLACLSDKINNEEGDFEGYDNYKDEMKELNFDYNDDFDYDDFEDFEDNDNLDDNDNFDYDDFEDDD